jgi:hypothetical protein
MHGRQKSSAAASAIAEQAASPLCAIKSIAQNRQFVLQNNLHEDCCGRRNRPPGCTNMLMVQLAAQPDPLQRQSPAPVAAAARTSPKMRQAQRPGSAGRPSTLQRTARTSKAHTHKAQGHRDRLRWNDVHLLPQLPARKQRSATFQQTAGTIGYAYMIRLPARSLGTC